MFKFQNFWSLEFRIYLSQRRLLVYSCRDPDMTSGGFGYWNLEFTPEEAEHSKLPASKITSETMAD